MADLFGVAEVRDLDAVSKSGFENSLAFHGLDLLLVDLNGNGIGHGRDPQEAWRSKDKTTYQPLVMALNLQTS